MEKIYLNILNITSNEMLEILPTKTMPGADEFITVFYQVLKHAI